MNKNWSNTVLVAYSCLPKIVEELNFGVKTRVKSSFRSEHLKSGVSTEQLIGEIIQLNDEKHKLINLRFIVADALNLMPDIDRKMLVERVVRKHTFQEISDKMHLSIRTVFRRLERAEQNFQTNLKNAGYDEGWLEHEYGKDKYISAVYKRISEDKYMVAKNF